MNRTESVNKGTLYVLSAYLMWGVLPGYWKQMLHIPSIYLMAVRIVFTLFWVTVMLTVMRKWSNVCEAVKDKRELKILCIAALGNVGNWGLYTFAVNSAHMLDACLAYYMNPIFSVLLGALVFREKLSRTQWIAVGLAATGICLAMLHSGYFPWLAVLTGASFTIYSAAQKKAKSDSYTSLFVETFMAMPLGLGIMGVLTVQGLNVFAELPGAKLLLLPGAGLVTLIPLLFFAYGMQRTALSVAGILMYINPTMQMLTGIFRYGEEFTVTHAILFGFVWAALILYLSSSWIEHFKHSHHHHHRHKEAHTCV